jgi:hypothetical protein
MPYKLVWAKEYGETFLATKPPFKGKPADDATLEQIAEMCDQEAENANHHGMVGVHAWLAKVLQKECGDWDVALRIMRTIAEHGGLHEIDEV